MHMAHTVRLSLERPEKTLSKSENRLTTKFGLLGSIAIRIKWALRMVHSKRDKEQPFRYQT